MPHPKKPINFMPILRVIGVAIAGALAGAGGLQATQDARVPVPCPACQVCADVAPMPPADPASAPADPTAPEAL